MRSALLLLPLLGMLSRGLPARILAILPFPGRSHYIYMSAVLKSLTQRGHHVVEYSPFGLTKPMPNYTHFEIHTSIELFKNKWTYSDFVEMSNTDKHLGGFEFRPIWKKTYSVCEETLQNEKIKNLLDSTENFDLVLIESTFGQESMSIFGYKFGAPVISLQGFPTWSGVNRNTGNALAIASVPDLASFIVGTDRMAFFERFQNLVSIVLAQLTYHVYHLPKHEKIIQQNYKQDIPPLIDLIRNISLYLVNSHPAIEYTRPYTPNIIPIGGITNSFDRISLPQDITNFMDKAQHGVVYFSFGTVVPAHILPNETIQVFVNVFKTLPVNIIWKIDLKYIPGLSKNVMLTPWVPQPGVLAHPKCVLFITHGGLFSLQDAIFAGVPIVGIPFFGDQHANIRLSEYHGFGVKVDLKYLSEKTLNFAINTALSNSRFKENAERMSKVFRDRSMAPADSAVFWVEYVLRHRGAHHLRSTAAQLPWYQYTMLDVILFIIAALLAMLFATYLTLKTILLFVFFKYPIIRNKIKYTLWKIISNK